MYMMKSMKRTKQNILLLWAERAFIWIFMFMWELYGFILCLGCINPLISLSWSYAIHVLRTSSWWCCTYILSQNIDLLLSGLMGRWSAGNDMFITSILFDPHSRVSSHAIAIQSNLPIYVYVPRQDDDECNWWFMKRSSFQLCRMYLMYV